MSVKLLVQEFLSQRPHKIGETVEFEWFIFKITSSGRQPEIETLDFREIASFTKDFSEVDRIYTLQKAALNRLDVNSTRCTLWQSAVVSISYSPGRDDVFIERQTVGSGNDSGWYVGVFNETCDMNDARSFVRRSLYELTIHDMRMAPFWLLPPSVRILLATGDIKFR